MKNKFPSKIKLTVTVFLCITLSMSFTACGGLGNDVEQTNNSLTIYPTSGYSFYGENAETSSIIQAYKSLYPDVEVKLIYNTGEDPEIFQKKIETDILAGKGPDLLYIHWGFYRNNNVDSMIRSGAFADMTPFIKADKDFDYSNYIESAMKIGILDGKRYLMPTSFDIPILLTTQSILDETRFNIDNCKDFWGFSNELTKYYESETKKEHMGFSYGLSYLGNFCNLAGINAINYNEKQTSLDSEEFKKGADFIKKIYNKNDWYDENFNGNLEHDYLINRKKIFTYTPYSQPYYNSHTSGKILENGEKPVFLPIRDINGKIQASLSFGAAINNSSPNKQNAYNFVKLLLSDSTQRFIDHRISVSKKEIEKLATSFPKGNSKVNTDFFKNIESVNVTTTADVILNEKMLPYYKDEKSYEECIKEAKESIEIYLSE